MNNTNIENDINSDELTIESDRRARYIPMIDSAPDDTPVWIMNEDGSGQWSDQWTGPAFLESDLPF